jgi:hypothetical protein
MKRMGMLPFAINLSLGSECIVYGFLGSLADATSKVSIRPKGMLPPEIPFHHTWIVLPYHVRGDHLKDFYDVRHTIRHLIIQQDVNVILIGLHLKDFPTFRFGDIVKALLKVIHDILSDE